MKLTTILVALALILPCSLAQATTFTVTNAQSSGAGSFRQAVTDANTAPGADQIHFNIPGPGPHVILIDGVNNGPLVLTDGLRIDGTTQPGYAPGAPQVVIDGNTADFVQVQSSEVEVMGLEFRDCPIGGLFLSVYVGVSPVHGISIHDNVFTRCASGLRIFMDTGVCNQVAFMDNRLDACDGIVSAGVGNALPTTTHLDSLRIERNAFTGTTMGAVGIDLHVLGSTSDSSTARHIVIRDNDFTLPAPIFGSTPISLTVEGQGGATGELSDVVVAGNSLTGAGGHPTQGIVLLAQSFNNDWVSMHHVRVDSNTVMGLEYGIQAIVFGDSTSDVTMEHLQVRGNEVADTALIGVELFRSTDPGTAALRHVLIQDNHLHGNKTGIMATLNGPIGVAGGAGDFSDIVIQANHVHHNVLEGIHVMDFDSAYYALAPGIHGLEITLNSIHDNGGRGILIDDQFLAGADCELPVPEDITAGIGWQGLWIDGKLSGEPNTDYRIEFFDNNVFDPSGYGEGELFVGADTVTTDGAGDAIIMVRTYQWTFLSGYWAATATNLSTHNTGCFSEVGLTTGIEKPISGTLTLFPNPATGDWVRFAPPAGVEVQEVALFAADGRLVRSLGADAEAVNVAGLSSGVYALVLRSVSGTYGGRVVIGQ